MFPHTHAYTVKEITGRSDKLLIYGSVLPDIALTKIIGWEEASKKAEEFRKWLVKNDVSYSDVGLGMMLHEFPCGIDRFTHTSYKGGEGYAYALSKPIIKDVAECCKADEKLAKTLAHNFIETGVEFFVLRDNPEIIDLLRNSVKSVDTAKIANYFSEFYEKPKPETEKAFKFYNQYLTGQDFTKIDGLVGEWQVFMKAYFGKELDATKTREVIEKSIRIVEDSYQTFLSDVIKACKADAQKYL